MKLTDGRELPVYTDEDQGRHAPGPQENWQESVVLTWWDLNNAVGGMHRIGHEVNLPGGGMVTLWNNLFTPKGIYKQTSYLPLRPEDAEGMRFGSGDDSCFYDFDGNCTWTIEDGDIAANLRIRDYHASADFYPKSGTLTEDFAPHHMEVAGDVVGSVRVRGAEYAIQGLGMRDHGWGPRDWTSLLSHRWIAGVFGPELSFIALSWHATDDTMAKFGWVVRGDEVTYAAAVDILSYVECDAATIRGGHVRFTLPDGEILDIECTPLSKGVMSFHHGIACCDTMCRTDYNGMTGICDFETSANLQHGQRRPGSLVNAVSEDGFLPA